MNYAQKYVDDIELVSLFQDTLVSFVLQISKVVSGVAVCRAYSYDVTAAILVFQNKQTTAMLVYQAIPPGIKLDYNAKIVFCFSKPIWPLVT